MVPQSLVGVVFSLAAAKAAAFQCTTALDCNLNGECEGGKCRCDAAWRADDCGELALLPVPSDLRGAYQTRVNLSDCAVSCGPSSWGGLPLKGADGKYHLFASLFVQNCTEHGWNPSSTIVRAVADDPMARSNTRRPSSAPSTTTHRLFNSTLRSRAPAHRCS